MKKLIDSFSLEMKSTLKFMKRNRDGDCDLWILITVHYLIICYLLEKI